MRALAAALVFGILIAGPTACDRTRGERCEVDSDCASGLFCRVLPDSTPSEGGTCQPLGTPLPDAAPPDGSAEDAEPDSAPDPDA